jgi:hypothetical protein
VASSFRHGPPGRTGGRGRLRFVQFGRVARRLPRLWHCYLKVECYGQRRPLRNRQRVRIFSTPSSQPSSRSVGGKGADDEQPQQRGEEQAEDPLARADAAGGGQEGPEVAGEAATPVAAAVGGPLLEVLVLGSHIVRGPGGKDLPKGLAELATLLASRCGQEVSAATITESLKGRNNQPLGPAGVHKIVSRLRHEIGKDGVVLVGQSRYRLQGVASDLVSLRQLVAAADATIGEERAELLLRAVALVRGLPYSDAIGCEWATAPELLDELCREVAAVFAACADALLGEGRIAEAEITARKWLAWDDSDRRVWAVLLRSCNGDPRRLHRTWLEAERAEVVDDELAELYATLSEAAKPRPASDLVSEGSVHGGTSSGSDLHEV